MNLIDRISQDLSLRAPQKAALQRLDLTLRSVTDLRSDPAAAEADTQAAIGTFERFDTSFPSFCFQIATAVGKTRLMGACIAYLYHTYGWRNYFILTTGNTIYRKTIANFTPGNAKYTLTGYTDLPTHELITGDNYERAIVADRLRRAPQMFSTDYINVFVFNVEKLFDNKIEQRRFRDTTNEILGDSMANLLASQPDLVLLMDESHRYRANASMAAIDDLKPLLGLEFTATPAGKNIIYRYDLGQAIRDSLTHLHDTAKPSGYIKVPVVIGRRDMHGIPGSYDSVQLADGIARHRQKKTELQSYCINNELPLMVPIALISTKNIQHANEVRSYLESDEFYGGEYKGKIVVTHSKTGDLRDDDISGLLELEASLEKEIVIHVNKLREGWDVRNVYTIIPLRASKSDVLTEQTIGRGLRLPFGVQTGDEDLDSLEIAAHDHFAAIVRDAHTNATRHGVPITTKEVTNRDREETEIRTIEPDLASSHLINSPYLKPSYTTEGRLENFAAKASRLFTDVTPTLVGAILGESTQREYDVPAYEMSDDPVAFLVRALFNNCDSISADDERDYALVPDLVRKYLHSINSRESTWKATVQAHAAELLSDLIHQIEEHVVERTTVTWTNAGSATWRPWTRSVPVGFISPAYNSVSNDSCTKILLSGYKKSVYAEAVFDSKQEKWLSDIFERDAKVKSWVRMPIGQVPIFYVAGDYNPDFIVETKDAFFLLEVKRFADLDESTVLRKSEAAEQWCTAASASSARQWLYRLIPHDSIQEIDTFEGVLSKAVRRLKNLRSAASTATL